MDFEEDGEIEYLDEDADIVQQCIQLPLQIVAEYSEPVQTITPEVKPLLVERLNEIKANKRRPPVEEDESPDYNPSDEVKPSKKRKSQATPSRLPAKKLKSVLNLSELLIRRRKMNIRIPDYEDPLCLPVKMYSKEPNDIERLRNWNSLCLEAMKKAESPLRADGAPSVSSKQIVVLRNVKHNVTGKLEVSVWGKTVVSNKDGRKVSNVFQSILPKFREKTTLIYNTAATKRTKGSKTVDTTLLTKEVQSDCDTLVVYKPHDAVSAVYKLIDNTETERSEDGLKKRYMNEVVVTKICSPCYQTSWRPTRTKNDRREISCPVCARIYMSVHNFLAHIKTHDADSVRKFRKQISTAIAELVDYHYKCRICIQTFQSIKELRLHLKTHTCSERFMCEVGNHYTQ